MTIYKAVKDVLDEFDFMKNESDNAELFTAMQALRQAYAEPYVPMTDDELVQAYLSVHTSIEDGFRNIEAAVLARLGIEVGK